MYAAVVRVTLNDPERAGQALNEVVVPGTKQSAGFKAGYWTRSEDGGNGLSFILFESEDDARGFAQRLQDEGPPIDVVTLDGVEVREVLASA